jgi:hypothetical protein
MKLRIITFNASVSIVKTLACEFFATSLAHHDTFRTRHELPESVSSLSQRKSSSPTSLQTHINMRESGPTLLADARAQIKAPGLQG